MQIEVKQSEAKVLITGDGFVHAKNKSQSSFESRAHSPNEMNDQTMAMND